ncbi:MAG: GNAT family N-acetyltransferase, partial [Phenylobacterium sp.]|nr:GNAT family N-acetyltransferase [Phenylobacterium sp.]
TAAVIDVEACVQLAESRRALYETFEPRFWRRAENAAEMSRLWFTHLFAKADVLALVAERDGQVRGFLVAQPTPSPPVYDPGGRTALIDDFVVEPADWQTAGVALLADARDRLRADGYAQIVVVGARLDAEKTRLLQASDLSLASTWWTAAV